MQDRPRRIPFRYTSMCLVYTVCASVLFLFAPLGMEESVSSSGAQSQQRVSLLQMNGWKIVLVLGLPVVFAAVPVVFRRSAHLRTLCVAAAVLLCTYCVLGALSIGVYFAPSAGLMIAAAATTRNARATRTVAMGYRPADPSQN
ncbi:MAG TPA: hypothetical protein VEM41_08840 [Actinomycetota bacterium]|nr:hypothetical protein [Actinomycetota bacterium]